MINFLKINKEYIIPVIMVVLWTILTVTTCRRTVPVNTFSTVVRDTAYITHDTVFKGVPIIVKSERDTIIESYIEYVPSENYDSLVEQFTQLKQQLLTKNSYSQTLHHDSSSVTIDDTVQQNKIIGRKVDFNLKYPVITNTITNTIVQPKKNKFYIGGELGGNKENLLNLAEAGFMYQTKSDNLFKGTVQLDFNGNVTYKFGRYWKIKLKK